MDRPCDQFLLIHTTGRVPKVTIDSGCQETLALSLPSAFLGLDGKYIAQPAGRSLKTYVALCPSESCVLYLTHRSSAKMYDTK